MKKNNWQNKTFVILIYSLLFMSLCEN